LWAEQQTLPNPATVDGIVAITAAALPLFFVQDATQHVQSN